MDLQSLVRLSVSLMIGGIDEKRARAAIEQLRSQGDIFEPKSEECKTM